MVPTRVVCGISTAGCNLPTATFANFSKHNSNDNSNTNDNNNNKGVVQEIATSMNCCVSTFRIFWINVFESHKSSAKEFRFQLTDKSSSAFGVILGYVRSGMIFRG